MPSMMVLIFALSSLSTLFTFAEAQQHAPEVQSLMNWFVEQEGTVFNPKQEVRREFPNDPSSVIGVFATQDVSEGEILFSIPWNTTINAGHETNADEALVCDTVHNLIREMKLGNESDFAPYAQYLLQQKQGQLPSAWSKGGRDLLWEILGGKNNLPPSQPFDWITVDWRRGCRGSADPFDENAAMLVVQRAEDDIMIPIYDMYNHRNGPYHNTLNTRVERNRYYMTALRDIEQGEQIYNSYNLCSGCEGRSGSYGTAEIFRDYGFVEQMPQRWIFPEHNFAFQLEEVEPFNSGNNELQVKWGRRGEPLEEAVDFMTNEILRLERLKKLSEDDDEYSAIPPHERDAAWKYTDAIIVALKHAVRAAEGGTSESCTNMPVDGYDALLDEIDNLPYEGFITCEASGAVDVDSYAVLETTSSAYQEMSFFGSKEADDYCFALEGTTQICTSYRPHYHELMVHIPASYIDSVRRVVFVGGGDSMLLHEVLKYPLLELVVGLELDQLVVRKSFQYFHTQPHFDDGRVEWWFGDAAKSLLVLPRDYFGSFDLVLVDLSETVMSFAVSKKLDMLQSLAMLLNHDGIMIKNELYLEKMNTMFDYTAQIYYPNVPFLCDQIIVMGSNGRDFLTQAPIDHEVEMKLFDGEERLRFINHFHDYGENNLALKEEWGDIEGAGDSDQYDRRAGVLMLVEVENISISLAPLARVEEIFAETLKKEGMQCLSTIAPSPAPTIDADGNVMSIVMEEGYVAARVWPEKRYCALDIHLWASFNKLERLRDALLEALGSDHSSLSSYKIVTGGMQGTSTWDEDHKTIGPRMMDRRDCDGDSDFRDDDLADESSLDSIMEESLNLVQDEDALAVVLCGPDKDSCKSIDGVSKHKKIGQALYIPACPEFAASSEFSQHVADAMFKCEKATLKALRTTVESNGKIGAFVVDPSAPLSMIKIATSIWSSHRNLDNLLSNHFIFLALMPDHRETWRQKHNFMDRVRKVLKFDPLFAAEIAVSGPGGDSMELAILSCNDSEFFSHLRSAVGRIEERTKLSVGTRKVTGGLWQYLGEDTYNPRVFSAGNYDTQPAKDQFMAQKFLGRQSVAQFIVEKKDTTGELLRTGESLRISLERTLRDMKYSAEGLQSFNVGDGTVNAAVFSQGGVVLIWDGATHIVINIYLHRQHEYQMKKLLNSFAKKVPDATLTLRDDQPRGINVVTFIEDIK